MLAKPQYTVKDWLDLHELSLDEVLDYCSVIRQKLQIERPNEPRDRSKGLASDIVQSLEHLVLPVFRDLLGVPASEKYDFSTVKIINHKADDLDLPFTEWDTKSNVPIVHLVWSGTADDLICLAHTEDLNPSVADEDIAAFRMSLSPQALHAVRTGKIDYAWLYRPANAGYVVENRVEGIAHLPAQLWVKWRSLGLFALAALNRGEVDILPSTFLEKYEHAATEPPELRFAAAAPWVSPLKFDALTALGMTIQQLSKTPYHQQFNLSYYLPVEILPALTAMQHMCFCDIEGVPLGLVTWAWLAERTKNAVHKTGRALGMQEWVGGGNLFFNDWITDKRAFKAAMKFMIRDMFSDQRTASSLRRNTGGSVRKINRWVRAPTTGN